VLVAQFGFMFRVATVSAFGFFVLAELADGISDIK
jgi:hypothetical protein